MNYTTITPPALEPVDLTELKQFCRITHDAEDALLTFFIRTAREWVEQTTHQLLIEQRIKIHISFDLRNPKIRLTDSRTGVLIPWGPISHIHHVHRVQADGKVMLLSREQYQLNCNGQANILMLKSEEGTGLEIDCTVGYGPRAQDVPAYLRHLLLQWAAHLYERRDMEDPTMFAKVKEWMQAQRLWRLT